jgi:transcriptional regulator with GAF, ATPase, and Fis domain
MDSLVDYTWPGNVRELQNVVERAVILTQDTVLHLFPFEKTDVHAETASASKTLEQVEREHILQTLNKTDWVIGGPYGAAAKLGMRRTTLLYKMRRLGISRPET